MTALAVAVFGVFLMGLGFVLAVTSAECSEGCADTPGWMADPAFGWCVVGLGAVLVTGALLSRLRRWSGRLSGDRLAQSVPRWLALNG